MEKKVWSLCSSDIHYRLARTNGLTELHSRCQSLDVLATVVSKLARHFIQAEALKNSGLSPEESRRRGFSLLSEEDYWNASDTSD